MGCLKIIHSEQKSALSESWIFFVGGVEKSSSSEKNRINYYPGGSLQPGRVVPSKFDLFKKKIEARQPKENPMQRAERAKK